MHIKTTFNAGIGFDTQGEPMDPAQVGAMAVPAIRAMLAKEYGGFTESSVIGGWDDGTTVITEAGFQWVALEEGNGLTVPNAIHKAESIAREIAAVLNQSAVLATVEEVFFAFVSQRENVEA